MSGSEIAPQRRSATTVAALCRSTSEGERCSKSHGRRSRSASREIVAPIKDNCLSISSLGMRFGTRGRRTSSIALTRLPDTPDNPINRSRAIGGAVDIRKMGRISGRLANEAGEISNKSRVCSNASSTAAVVRDRVSIKVGGAYWKNHWLYKSTDWAISTFHKSILSRLTGTSIHLSTPTSPSADMIEISRVKRLPQYHEATAVSCAHKVAVSIALLVIDSARSTNASRSLVATSALRS